MPCLYCLGFAIGRPTVALQVTTRITVFALCHPTWPAPLSTTRLRSSTTVQRAAALALGSTLEPLPAPASVSINRFVPFLIVDQLLVWLGVDRSVCGSAVCPRQNTRRVRQRRGRRVPEWSGATRPRRARITLRLQSWNHVARLSARVVPSTSDTTLGNPNFSN